MSAPALKIKSLFTAVDTTGDILRISFFAIITVVAAQISIPVQPVPFTLQSVAVILAGVMLGSKKGAISQIIYLMLGIIGLPVFAMSADPTLGVARLIGPTGGYLLAFPIAAYVSGFIVEKFKGSFSLISAIFAGNALILISGVAFLNTFYLNDINQALVAGVGIFGIWSVVKMALTFGIFKAVKK